MPTIFFFILFVSAVIVVFGLAEVLLLRHLNRVWWQKKSIRILAWSLPIIGLTSFVLFGASEYYGLDWLSLPAACVAVLSFILEVALMLSLPVSGVIHLVNRTLDRFLRHDEEPKSDLNRHRRLFLRGAAAAIPLATLSMGVFGVGRAFLSANVYRRKIHLDTVPSSLGPLSVLHLSDLHLRHYVTLEDLEFVMEKAEVLRPDLTLITGDIADDLGQLPDALRMIDQLRPPLGTFASLGNHEYYRGLQEVTRIFDRSPIPLLVNEGLRISHEGHSLFIGGIDDPRRIRGGTPEFFNRCLDDTLLATRSDDIVLLMSHRPEAIEQAALRKVHFVFSGHTHGSQVGFMGRSVFEASMPDKYLWGHYRLGDCHLYTTSGMGHWFPFRLGCPPEAPVIELVPGSKVTI